MKYTVAIISKNEQVLGGSRNVTNYIEFIYEREISQLTMKTTPNFAQYELAERETTMIVELELNCDTASKTLFTTIFLNEKNNFDPIFQEDEYDFTVPLPLPKNFDVTQIVGEILAVDNDLINNQVTFETDSTDFEIGLVTAKPDKRTFGVQLLTSHQLLRIDDFIEFNLKATDAGTPPRSSEIKIRMRTDSQIIFVETPQFEKMIYETQLKPDLTIDPITVSITESTYSDEIEIKLEECKL